MTGSNIHRPYPWRVFAVLLGAGLLATVALLPYLGELSRHIAAHTGRPIPHLGILQIALALLQSAILLAIETGIGLVLIRRIGLEVPILTEWLYGQDAPELSPTLRSSVVAGLLSGFAVIALLVWVFIPRIPQLLSSNEYQYPVWKRFLAAFYGGVAEEILMRLFLMTLLAWVISKIWHQENSLPTSGALWTANIIAAVAFGLGHLPIAVALDIPVNAITITDAITVNGIVGMTCGWLYMSFGFEAAMVAHFCADIVLHVVGPQFVP